VSNKIAAVKRDRTRTELMAAYEAYQRREPASMDKLLLLVRKFVYLKLYHLEYDFKDFGSAETVDDWTQDVTIKVWQELKEDRFEGTPAQFYSWVHKIAFNKASEAFNKLDEERATSVPLFIKSDDGGDENGDTYEEDNPAIYEDRAGSDRSYVRIPASVQGTDLMICNLLLTTVRGEDGKYRGRTYANVAGILNMTENAVAQRMKRLQDRFRAERKRGKGGTGTVAAD
jgi:DNA-directed RNA polymerase specialized sigma24 family protein